MENIYEDKANNITEYRKEKVLNRWWVNELADGVLANAMRKYEKEIKSAQTEEEKRHYQKLFNNIRKEFIWGLREFVENTIHDDESIVALALSYTFNPNPNDTRDLWRFIQAA